MSTVVVGAYFKNTHTIDGTNRDTIYIFTCRRAALEDVIAVLMYLTISQNVYLHMNLKHTLIKNKLFKVKCQQFRN